MNHPPPSWDLYRSFLAVLREGSLSAAARSLGLTQPTLARHVAALEEAVGGSLFLRSPRGLDPTDAALALKPQAEALDAVAAGLWRTASGWGAEIGGTVRITASEVVGGRILPAILAGLRTRHPALEVELVLSNGVDDLLQRDADVAVRMVEPVQQALVVRRIGVIALGMHAHRDYLDRHGVPQSLEDLGRHSLIGFDRETPDIRAMMRRAPAIALPRFALRSDSHLAQLAAIEAGFGIGICQVPLARRNPALRRVLADAFDMPMGVWVAMHGDLRSTPRCRAIFDGLAAGLAEYVDPARPRAESRQAP
ncbi:LysR family transcriptional regulator [Azospirillum thiophilum]|uniref:LysR family transcriptional regulator n=1 Tax=Azospirillum thiophilum TaxID=528244 RepID=A0AAC8ZTK1_9PROT|nr:LysR family transcriptional regulator [Azospirillum thiophilum]ALG70135.1 LysR family transcriptional regulator [Azospirillum thiophilum]KJR66184.1 LysR family transcriptional regulator [Azospirillum thiophilum]